MLSHCTGSTLLYSTEARTKSENGWRVDASCTYPTVSSRDATSRDESKMIALAAQAAALFVAAGVPPTAQVFQFPDGSMYRGEVQDGMQHGYGEWRSAEGDLYIGQFERGAFEGTGRYADANGNVFTGSFSGGVFHGVGTYIYADGRAERSRYEHGQEAGHGVRWSHSRARAWRLRDGTITEEMSSEDAVAAALELDPTAEMPPAWYAPTADGEGRLNERIAAGWSADDDD